jgi:hypothetical protein
MTIILWHLKVWPQHSACYDSESNLQVMDRRVVLRALHYEMNRLVKVVHSCSKNIR